METAEREAWLKLGLIPRLGPATFRTLLAEFGSPEAAANAGRAALAKSVGNDLAAAIQAGPEPGLFAETEAWLSQPENRLLTLADENYPQRLLEIPDPPPLLFLKGDPGLLARDAVAIVGSRNATPQGTANAEAFARELSDCGFTIISGLALGIDAAAHLGGLSGGGSSIAIVGTGLDLVYPARNRDLARQLAERGLLISEFPLGTKPLAGNFPRRNRLISGLSRGVLVVEAALQSGSLITTRYALEQGRDVFAIPGSIHSSLSKGCHLLIKQGAKLVEQSSDIIEELCDRRRQPNPSRILPRSGKYPMLLEAMGFDPIDLDTLCFRSGLTPESASAMLLEMELDGDLSRLHGGKFQRIR